MQFFIDYFIYNNMDFHFFILLLVSAGKIVIANLKASTHFIIAPKAISIVITLNFSY